MSDTTHTQKRKEQSRQPDTPLWSALSRFSFDQKAPYPFSQRLAKENEWNHDVALRVIEEYRKFIYLLATVSTDLVPPPVVETAWRLHLIYTRSYWIELCNGVLDKPIPHRVDDGSESPDKIRAHYSQTIEAYQVVFGTPPEDIWTVPEPKGSRSLLNLFRTSQLSKETEAARATLRPTEESVAVEHREMWLRLKNFPLDKPGALFPFTRRLAQENGWTLPFTMLVVREYKRFMYLMATTGHMVTPALAVDEVWHMHVGETDSYWNDMGAGILGNKFHHFPGDGSEEDEIKFQAIFQRTLWDYQQVFGNPPFEVWGRPNASIHWPLILKDAND